MTSPMKHQIHADLVHLARPINEVRINPANTNTHPEEQLEVLASMFQEFGQRGPLIVRKSTGILEAGEGRLLAMRRLGWTHVAVLECDDDSIAAVRFSIGDNQSARLSVDDEERLAREIKALLEVGSEVAGLGFDEDNVIDLLATLDDPGSVAEADEEDLVETGAPPFLVLGDLVIIGPHRLVIGDSTVAAVIERLMAGELADLVFTDPPYGVAYEGAAGVIENDDLGFEGTRRLVAEAVKLWPLRPGGAWYVACASAMETAFRLAIEIDAGERLRQSIVWVKNAPTLTRSDYQWQHEPILYGWREGAAHYWCGSRTERTVWDHRKPGRSKEHPTMKPVELVAQAITNSSRPSDVVFDGFGGGGSTMRAAHQLGRRARLVELSPGYGDAICRSMRKLGERPVVIRGAQEFEWVDNRPEEGT